MTYLDKLKSSDLYQLRPHGALDPKIGTFRELTMALIAEMGCSIVTRQLVTGRWVGSAIRGRREIIKSHQCESESEAETDLLVELHCRMPLSYRRRYFRATIL